ncbi:MAG TPA: hypothetical protein VKU89_02840, partial [Solirubrobacteraceae bacterium]|nr:hypothetical protein [Solirubrobacteraceae bacterium]
GEEDLSGITLKLPEGLLANLNGVKLCEEAQAAEGSCPAESKVGSASVSAGAGSEPLSLAGSVYLTGPYKGAPFGLAIVVPAIAGPYNLGTVVVRAAVGLNMTNGQLSITTDALPQIVGGVPLRIRSVKIEINRSGFLVNPTSCGAASVSGQTTSSGGQGAAIADALTVEGCSGLAFAPTFALTSSTSRRDWPSTLGIALHLPAGNAALKQTVITLPPGLSLNPPAASGIEGCATEALGLGSESPITCPAASEIGTVAITSPLLPGALSGKLYVGAPLNADPESGEEYRLFLAAKSATYNISLRLIGKLIANRETGQLRAVFEGLPPLPFSEMTLQVNGGKQPLFATPLACGTAVADATLTPASGGAAATPSASFSVDNNGAGEACPATLPFAPKSSAQLSSKQAGAPTSLALTI